MANTQESLHSLYTKKLDATILQLDLKKAYDSLDWGFLRCILCKIGLNNDCISWIMVCVENAKFVVLINGLQSNFFLAARGLRYGCSLSPLLFILAMDSLSLHIKNVVKDNQCRPLMICQGNFISHSLSVDYITIYGMLSRFSWECIHGILKNFQRASGIYINEGKFSFYSDEEDTYSVEFMRFLFNIEVKPIKEGIKYLGFHLKPSGYTKADWMWISDLFLKELQGGSGSASA